MVGSSVHIYITVGRDKINLYQRFCFHPLDPMDFVRTDSWQASFKTCTCPCVGLVKFLDDDVLIATCDLLLLNARLVN